MSKYHPLDVRHPDNVARERKSFLLEPATASTYGLKPLRDLAPTPERRTSSDTPVAQTTTAPSSGTSTAATFAPWGNGDTNTQSASASPTPATSVSATRRQSRGGGRWIWTLFYMGIIAFFVLRNTELGTEIERFIMQTLWNMGLL